MNARTLVTAVALLAAFSGFSKLTSEEMHKKVIEHAGGEIRKPGTGKGHIFIDNKAGAPDVAIDKAVCNFQSTLKISVSRKVEDAATAAATVRIDNLDSGVFLLHNPDAKLVTVNFAALKADKPADDLLARRVEKEVARALAFVLGSGLYCWPGSILAPIKDLAALDAAKPDIDGMAAMAIQNNLEAFGLAVFTSATYRNAVREGWAPAPTNKWQKKVWDKVHEIPAKPLKITYDKQKQKPVTK